MRALAHQTGCFTALLLWTQLGCFPGGRGLSLPASLQPQGSILAFLHVPAAEEMRIVGIEGVDDTGFELDTVLPAGEVVQAALFVYACPDLGKLGIELEAPDQPVTFTDDRLALRAPDQIISTELRPDLENAWTNGSFEELPADLKQAISDRLPTLPNLTAPFLPAPPCAPHELRLVPNVEVEADTRPRFAIPLDEGQALVGLGTGELTEVSEDGSSTVLYEHPQGALEAAHLDGSGRLWIIRNPPGERRLESIMLSDLRAGNVSFELGPSPPPRRGSLDDPECAGVRETSLAGSVGASPFELFMLGGDGAFARFDGETWTSTDTFIGGRRCNRKAPRVIWRGPGRAVASHAERQTLVGYDASRGFFQLSGTVPHPPTALLDVPGIGLVLGTDRFEIGVLKETGVFELLPGGGAFTGEVFEDLLEALVLAPDGFFAAGDTGRLLRYVELDLGSSKLSHFCVVNEVEETGRVISIPHISFAARAGDGIVLVPREFMRTSFGVSLARPGDQSCAPAVRP